MKISRSDLERMQQDPRAYYYGTRQRGIVGRITIRYPRLVRISGWIITAAIIVLTFAIGYGAVWALFAAFPGLGE